MAGFVCDIPLLSRLRTWLLRSRKDGGDPCTSESQQPWLGFLPLHSKTCCTLLVAVVTAASTFLLQLSFLIFLGKLGPSDK